MKIFLISLFVLFPIFNAFSTEVAQRRHESDPQFVERITHAKIIDKQIARTKELIKNKDVLIVFTEARPPYYANDEFNIQLNIFINVGKNSYEWLRVEACDVAGGNPSLRSFFYSNADSSADIEIGVICGWDSPHGGAECRSHDEVKFYKIPIDWHEGLLIKVEDEKFKAFYGKKNSDVTKDFECSTAKFSTASDVKKILLKIGF